MDRNHEQPAADAEGVPAGPPGPDRLPQQADEGTVSSITIRASGDGVTRGGDQGSLSLLHSLSCCISEVCICISLH